MPRFFLSHALLILLPAGALAQGEVSAPSLRADLAAVVRGLETAGPTRGLIADARKNVQVVFLPGIPGSLLVENGETIWGVNKAKASRLALKDPKGGPFAGLM